VGFSDYRFVFFVVFVANADASMKAFQTAARGTARSKMVRAGTLAQRAGIHALARSSLKHKIVTAAVPVRAYQTSSNTAP